MTTATITVQYVNLPKPGTKYGSVKDKTGQYYGVSPEMLPSLKAGQAYDVEYTEKAFNGRTYRTATKMTPVAGPASPPPSSGGYGRVDDTTAERIFVCGALNAILGNSTINPLEVDYQTVVVNLRATWEQTFAAGPPKKTTGEEISDENPF